MSGSVDQTINQHSNRFSIVSLRWPLLRQGATTTIAVAIVGLLVTFCCYIWTRYGRKLREHHHQLLEGGWLQGADPQAGLSPCVLSNYHRWTHLMYQQPCQVWADITPIQSWVPQIPLAGYYKLEVLLQGILNWKSFCRVF